METTVAQRRAPERLAVAQSTHATWAYVGAVWALSRVFFFVAGALGRAFLSPAGYIGIYPVPPGTFSYWANWDGTWFSHIAQHGYDAEATTAFFPLYPLLVHVTTKLGAGPALGGVIVSTAAALFGFFFVHRLAEHWFDLSAARAAVLALALFPPSLFLDAVYSESLFLALMAGSLWALYVRGDIFVAGGFAYFAAMTRNLGVLLVVPLAYEWFRHRRRYGYDGLLAVAGAPVGLATYCFYLWKVSHKPLLFSDAEKAPWWGRSAGNPFVTVWHAWQQAGDGVPYLFHPGRVFGTSSVNPPFLLSDTVNFVFLAVVAILVVLVFRWLPIAVAALCLALAVAPLFVPGPQIALIGYPRYALAVVPIFVVLGRVLSRNRALLAAWLLASGALATYLTLEFVTQRWVA